MSEEGMETTEPMKDLPKFIEKSITKSEAPRCVDGRPAHESEQGPQMLGGSLHPLVLEAIIDNSDFDNAFVENGLRNLSESGFVTGVHRGHHKDAEQGKSDCGFSDRLPEIIDTAKSNRDEISRRLKGIYLANGIDANSLSPSYDLLSNYDSSKIKIKGESLIGLSETNKATVEELQGDHQEQAAFVNLKPDTTLDTKEVNKQGKQAFNLDLGEAIKQGIFLTKASPDTLRDLSLIMYQATEMVLVEQKGKPALPVVLHQ